jgi:SAM-dependent methyltransferase
MSSIVQQIPAPPAGISEVGGGDYHAVGAEFARLAIDLGGLRPDDRVIEPGCGVGRIAAGLVEYLNPSGSYDGFDVMLPAVEWSRQEITSRYPNVRFRHVDVRNGHYNPSGSIAAEDFRFPYDNQSFDFALLTSVFTHLQPGDADRYLAEIARVLRPGRRCFATWALLDDEAIRLIAEGKSHREVPYDRGFFRLHSETTPEALIAYKESYVLDLYAGHGLRIVPPIWHGEWCGRQRVLTWQDVIVAVKEPLPISD